MIDGRIKRVYRWVLLYKCQIEVAFCAPNPNEFGVFDDIFVILSINQKIYIRVNKPVKWTYKGFDI